jgi:glucosamine-6-phosphate isomerase
MGDVGMKTFIFDTYAALSAQAAADLAALAGSWKNPLVCVASGDSPAGLYRNVVDKVLRKELDIGSWLFLGLDEWQGMNGSDEGSCRFHIDRELFNPLSVPDKNIFFFDGRAEDPVEECAEAESFIRDHGGISVAILGLGLNGHVGMNEPHTPVSSRAHVAQLEPITTQTGQKYFSTAQTLDRGLTLGLASLLESSTLFLLVSGKKKAAIVQRALEGDISEAVPASLLRRHPGLRVYLDEDAAGLLATPSGADRT